MTGAARRPTFGQTLGVRVRGVVLRGGTVREGGHRLEEFVDVMQVWHQLEPEGDFGGPVVVPDTRLQANVEVQLLFGGVLRPGHLFKSVRFSVDELSVLRNWLIWIAGKIKKKKTVSYLFTFKWVVVVV